MTVAYFQGFVCGLLFCVLVYLWFLEGRIRRIRSSMDWMQGQFSSIHTRLGSFDRQLKEKVEDERN